MNTRYVSKVFPADLIRNSVLRGESDPEHDIEFIEASSWQADQGEDWEWRRYIFKSGGKYYQVHDSRTGSPYSDYEYTNRDWVGIVVCQEVELREVVIRKWVLVEET